MSTGADLVKKWIKRNTELGLTDDQMDGTTFVYGNDVYTIKKTNKRGEFEMNAVHGKVVIFRDMKEITDEYTCRICGAEHDNKIETIRCCSNGDE